MRARIGRYTSESGVAATGRRFSRELENSTARGIKRGYLAQLNEKGVRDECVAIGRLAVK